MAQVLRGDIYWANLEPVLGHERGGVRPVLIISHDVFNDRSGTVIAMAVTSQPQRAGPPLTYRLAQGVLARPSWVKTSQIRTISIERLRDRLGAVGEMEVDAVVSGLVQLIG